MSNIPIDSGELETASATDFLADVLTILIAAQQAGVEEPMVELLLPTGGALCMYLDTSDEDVMH